MDSHTNKNNMFTLFSNELENTIQNISTEDMKIDIVIDNFKNHLESYGEFLKVL